MFRHGMPSAQQVMHRHYVSTNASEMGRADKQECVGCTYYYYSLQINAASKEKSTERGAGRCHGLGVELKCPNILQLTCVLRHKL